jgi:hypothetical protein
MFKPVVLLPIVACALLAGCDKPVTAAASPAPVVAGSGDSYELVQVKRQDPPHAQLNFYKDTAYHICATTARQLNVPVKPFPQLPADPVYERVTTITNGVSTVVKSERMVGDTSDALDYKTGCEVTISTEKVVNVAIFHANKATHISDGKVEDVVDMPLPAYAKGVKDTSDYTEARTHNGVAMRCLPKDFWIEDTNKYVNLREMCVYKDNDVLVNQTREPIVLLAHTKSDLFGPKHAFTEIEEPVSLRRIDKNEKDPYQAANYVR